MTDQPTTVDLTPLSELIDRQNREIRQLAEAAAACNVRALQAEERLQQLTAGETVNVGEDVPQRPQDAPGEERAGDVAMMPPRRDVAAGGDRWPRDRESW